jgi:hypothetical protein
MVPRNGRIPGALSANEDVARVARRPTLLLHSAALVFVRAISIFCLNFQRLFFFAFCLFLRIRFYVSWTRSTGQNNRRDVYSTSDDGQDWDACSRTHAPDAARRLRGPTRQGIQEPRVIVDGISRLSQPDNTGISWLT